MSEVVISNLKASHEEEFARIEASERIGRVLPNIGRESNLEGLKNGDWYYRKNTKK